MTERKQVCTFFLGSRMFGVEVLKVQEVIRYQEMTEIPLAPAAVRGLLNLRGSIVSTIDLRIRVGMPPLEGEQLPTNVVMQTSSGPVSILVDRIGDVVEVDGRDFEQPPPTMHGKSRELVEGIYKLPSGLLLILNVERVLDLEPALT